MHYGDAVPDGLFWFDCFPPQAIAWASLSRTSPTVTRAPNRRAGALQLLHRITVAFNPSSSFTDAAQLCPTEVCNHIGWPVGRLFLVDDDSPARFIPNPYLAVQRGSPVSGFRGPPKLYEWDLTNRLVLQHRVAQGNRAGLTRSVAFSILEGYWPNSGPGILIR